MMSKAKGQCMIPALCAAGVLLVFAGCASAPPAEAVPAVPETTEPADTGIGQQETGAANGTLEKNRAAFEALEAARQAAIDAGAQELYADEFAQADSRRAALQENWETQDRSAEIQDLADVYRSLELAAKARQARQEIEQRQFPDIDAEALAAAEQALTGLDSLYDAQAPGAELLTQAQAVYDAYSTLLLDAYEKYLRGIRDKVLAKKQEADDIKASAADSDNYAQAQALLEQADDDAQARLIDNAYAGYERAYESFSAVYERVAQMRAAAAAAIEQAKQKADEVDRFAAEADLITPIPEEDIADRTELEQEAAQ